MEGSNRVAEQTRSEADAPHPDVASRLAVQTQGLVKRFRVGAGGGADMSRVQRTNQVKL